MTYLDSQMTEPNRALKSGKYFISAATKQGTKRSQTGQGTGAKQGKKQGTKDYTKCQINTTRKIPPHIG